MGGYPFVAYVLLVAVLDLVTQLTAVTGCECPAFPFMSFVSYDLDSH